MSTERPYLHLITEANSEIPETKPKLTWDQIPESPEELIQLINFLPKSIEDLNQPDFKHLTTILENLKNVLDPINKDWYKDLNQFFDWEQVFSGLAASRTNISEFNPGLANKIFEIQTLSLTAIVDLGLRNEMDSKTNENPAFVYLLRLLQVSPEFNDYIKPDYDNKKTTPINHRHHETGLDQWSEDQRIIDQIGQMLASAQSLEELLHLLTLVPVTRITLHRTADYSSTYSLPSFISFITAEIESLAISNLTSELEKKEKIKELAKLLTTPDGSTSGIFPPNLGLFKTREFLYSELAKEFKLALTQKKIFKTPDQCQTWVQLLWYIENNISNDHTFVYTKKEANVEQIIRLTGDRIHAIVAQAPLDSASIEILPKASQFNFIKPDDKVIIGLREKLESWFS